MAMRDDVLTELEKIPWFQELRPQHVRRIASITTLERIKAGEVL